MLIRKRYSQYAILRYILLVLLLRQLQWILWQKSFATATLFIEWNENQLNFSINAAFKLHSCIYSCIVFIQNSNNMPSQLCEIQMNYTQFAEWVCVIWDAILAIRKKHFACIALQCILYIANLQSHTHTHIARSTTLKIN